MKKQWCPSQPPSETNWRKNQFLRNKFVKKWDLLLDFILSIFVLTFFLGGKFILYMLLPDDAD